MSSLPRNGLRHAAAVVSAWLIVLAAWLLTGVRAIWSGTTPKAERTLCFANHTSHGDFVLLGATPPADLRALRRPVAGQDCWEASSMRRFIGVDVFNALMIRRDGGTTAGAPNPVEQMTEALPSGDSLIIFPEGTRTARDHLLLPLKSGLFHRARACPPLVLAEGEDKKAFIARARAAMLDLRHEYDKAEDARA